MSDPAGQGRQKFPVGSPPGQSALAYMNEDSDNYHTRPDVSSLPRNGPLSAPPGNPSLLPERPNFPTRASTVSSPHDLDHRKSKPVDYPHARSEDLNHGVFNGPHDVYPVEQSYSKQSFLTASRPSTPGSSSNHNHLSASDHSELHRRRPPSVASVSSARSDSSANDGGVQTAATSTTHTTSSSSLASA